MLILLAPLHYKWLTKLETTSATLFINLSPVSTLAFYVASAMQCVHRCLVVVPFDVAARDWGSGFQEMSILATP